MDPIYPIAKDIWNYLRVNDSQETCDILLILGRDDFSIPEKVLDLYGKQVCSQIIIVGGRGRLTGNIEGSESEAFKKYLISRGIPESAITTEDKSTNTGENIEAGIAIMKKFEPKSVGIVTHGPHMRRALAYAQSKQKKINWIPHPDNCMLPPTDNLQSEKDLHEMVGEISRLERYPGLGYFEKQNIPREILEKTNTLEKFLENR